MYISKERDSFVLLLPLHWRTNLRYWNGLELFVWRLTKVLDYPEGIKITTFESGLTCLMSRTWFKFKIDLTVLHENLIYTNNSFLPYTATTITAIFACFYFELTNLFHILITHSLNYLTFWRYCIDLYIQYKWEFRNESIKTRFRSNEINVLSNHNNDV
jgi:hypothetical protein